MTVTVGPTIGGDWAAVGWGTKCFSPKETATTPGPPKLASEQLLCPTSSLALTRVRLAGTGGMVSAPGFLEDQPVERVDTALSRKKIGSKVNSKTAPRDAGTISQTMAVSQ